MNKLHKNKRRKNKTRQKPINQRVVPIELPEIDSDIQVNIPDVSDLPDNQFNQLLEARSVLIKSPIATGKTSLLKRILDSDTQDRSMLIISGRQSLASELGRRLKDLDFVVCGDKSGENKQRQNHSRMVCSYARLDQLEGRTFDIVAIDDHEQFYPQIWNNRMKGGKSLQCFLGLQKFIKDAKLFIGLDPYITKKSQDLIKYLRGGDLCTLENKYGCNKGQLIVCEYMEAVIERALIASREAHKPVVVVCSSKTRSEIIYQLAIEHGVEEKEIVLINANTTSKLRTKNFLANLNQEIASIKLLIVSPSVDMAYDIQTEVHGVYAIFGRQPLVSTQMVKMLSRYRNAGERWLYLPYSDYQNYETDVEQLGKRNIRRVMGTAATIGVDDIDITHLTQRSE